MNIKNKSCNKMRNQVNPILGRIYFVFHKSGVLLSRENS